MTATDVERAVAVLALSTDVLDPVTAVRVISAARREGRSLVAVLLENVNEARVLEAIAEALDMPFVDLHSTSSNYRVDEDTIRKCDIEHLKDRTALPMLGESDQVIVAMANPRDIDMVDYLKSRFPDGITVALASTTQIQAKLVYFEGRDYAEIDRTGPDAAVEETTRTGPLQINTSPIIEWVDNLFARASAEGASDVHFMFRADKSLLVRFRVDGMMRVQAVPLRGREMEIVGALLSKCPTIDPSDKTRPQDGTFSFLAAGGRQIDTRLAMLPQLHGPTVVVRLLDPRNVRRKLDDMGFAPQTLETMRRVVRNPQGAVFVIGPTGSGKTTTLYGLLNELDAVNLHILTAEHPVEYRMNNIGQTQIRDDLGDKSLTFAKALRAFLRLDPDVILVGEVRDSETSEVAMHAALTGHLVLSTIHANSAIGVFRRLEELGTEPFLTAEAMSLAISQRLVRRVHDCANVEAPSRKEAAFLARQGFDVPDKVAHVNEHGCGGCGGTGYRGRIPVLEVLEPNASVRTLVAEGAPVSAIAAAAAKDGGYTPILADAFRHVLAGNTTVPELLRTIDTGGH